ncbi:MAG: hypothetical protein GVY26_01930 [Bacteroidetes bacterium]|jgi:tetratricopeptide (TPR) repeat protein|nr:hypothetical protein [Bacteroidota bacterium]
MQVQSLWITLCFLLSTVFLGAQPQALLNQAAELSEKGQYRQANQLLDTFIANYPTREYDLGDAYYQKSENYYALGELNEAIAANEASLQIRLPFGAEELGKNYLLAGRITLGMLRLPDALASLQLADQFPFIDDPRLPAEVQRLLGKVYATAGKPRQALPYYDKALDNLAVMAGEDDPAYHSLLLEKARLWQPIAPDSAKALLSALVKKSPTAAHYQAMGDYYRQQQSWAAATGQYQQAYTRAASDAHLRKAELLLRLGQVALQQGQPATDYARQCMERLCPGFKAEAAADLPASGQDLRDTLLLIQALQLKAEQHLRTDDPQPQDLKHATAAAELGIQLFEQEASRYREFRLRKRQALPLLSVFDPLLYALRAQGEDEQVLAYADRMVQWHWYLNGLLERVSAAPVERVREGLQPDQALLSYHSSDRYMIGIAVSAEDIATAVIPLTDATGFSLTDAIPQFRTAISEEDGDAFSTLGYSLYERLLVPLADVVADKAHLQIYRNGALESLPFEALLTKAPKKRRRHKYHRMDFLGEETAITYSSRPLQAVKSGPLRWPKTLAVVPSFEGASGQLDPAERLMARLWTTDATIEEGQIKADPPAITFAIGQKNLKEAAATERRLDEALLQSTCLVLSAPYAERLDSPVASAFLLAQDTVGYEDGLWRISDWGGQLRDKGLVLIGTPIPEVVRTAALIEVSALLFAEAGQQNLLAALAEGYAGFSLAEATLSLRRAKAKKRRTAAPRHWTGLWVMAQ